MTLPTRHSVVARLIALWTPLNPGEPAAFRPCARLFLKGRASSTIVARAISYPVFALCMLLLSHPLVATASWNQVGGDQPQPQVQVVNQFIEWRTGPASGFPVFHASEKGEWLTLLKRRTAWLKVTDSKDRKGWVHVDDVLETVDGNGEKVTLSESGFNNRRWEIGLLVGHFEGDLSRAVYGGVLMTDHLSAELWATEISASNSRMRMVNANIVHQPFPHWRASPFITLGVGHVFIEPRSTAARSTTEIPEDRDSRTAHAGFGIRVHVTGRYFIRTEWKDYRIFNNQTSKEEAIEWKVGLSIVL